MTGYYHTTTLADEQKMFEEQIKNQEYYQLKGRNAPAFLNGEKLDQFQRRTIDDMKPHTRNYQKVNPYEVSGSMLPRLLDEVRADAIAEAQHPSMVPDGELRQVNRYDATGRPILEWYGRPSTWLSQFTSGTKKRLVGIRTQNEQGYRPW
jgi:hypothetical protein